MLVDWSFDDSGYVVDISFRGKKRMLPFHKNDSHMVVLSVLKNSVINDDVSRFRNKGLCPFMVFNPMIVDGKLLPAEACCQMTGFAFIGSIRNLESRFPAAI